MWLKIGRWHHIVVTNNGVYVNGRRSMDNIFGILVIALFACGTVQQALLHNWKLSLIYLFSAALNIVFLM